MNVNLLRMYDLDKEKLFIFIEELKGPGAAVADFLAFFVIVINDDTGIDIYR